MLTICELESDGIATASNWKDSHATCNGSHGILQVGCVHGHTVNELYDPTYNVEVAYDIYIKQGLDAWRTSYRKLLAYNQ